MTTAVFTPDVNKYSDMVSNLFKRGPDVVWSVMHAGVGVAGEVLELLKALATFDRENIKEELGDLMFYIQWLLDFLEIDLETVLRSPPSGVTKAALEDRNTFNYEIGKCIAFRGGEVINQCKRPWAYGKQLDTEKLLFNVCLVVTHMYTLLHQLQINDMQFTIIKVHNMNKLIHPETGRFPDGSYSDAAAIARADKKGAD